MFCTDKECLRERVRDLVKDVKEWGVKSFLSFFTAEEVLIAFQKFIQAIQSHTDDSKIGS
jgi:hypothetical protein